MYIITLCGEDIVNLSNLIDTRSDHTHIDDLYVTWWETAKNGTWTTFFIASNDNSFSSSIEGTANGTISQNGQATKPNKYNMNFTIYSQKKASRNWRKATAIPPNVHT